MNATTTTTRITDAVRRQIDNAGIIDTMRSRHLSAAQVARLDRLFREGQLGDLTPVVGWGHMTHHVRHDGIDYHVRVEE